MDILTSAKALLEAQSDHEELATVHAEMAAYSLLQGELDQAITRYLEVERSYQRAGTTEPTDRTLLMLGVLYRKKGDYTRAAAYLQRLFERAEQGRVIAPQSTVVGRSGT